MLFFWDYRALKESLHFAFQRINNFLFLFMQNYLWSSSMIGMVFGHGVCVCGLGGVYVGCGWGRKLVLH
jgi:hypothetical protein